MYTIDQRTSRQRDQQPCTSKRNVPGQFVRTGTAKWGRTMLLYDHRPRSSKAGFRYFDRAIASCGVATFEIVNNLQTASCSMPTYEWRERGYGKQQERRPHRRSLDT